MNERRAKDIMTEEELTGVHSLNKKVMTSDTKEQIENYRSEIKFIIPNAKNAILLGTIKVLKILNYNFNLLIHRHLTRSQGLIKMDNL